MQAPEQSEDRRENEESDRDFRERADDALASGTRPPNDSLYHAGGS